MIDQHVGYMNDYFNFGLNTTTWRLFVNKQILMRYERLFIERQRNDINNLTRSLQNEVADLK
jgi:Fip1 motif